MEPVFDVIIVGGGVVGCAVAWYLSHFDPLRKGERCMLWGE